jgi:hypothetical protein
MPERIASMRSSQKPLFSWACPPFFRSVYEQNTMQMLKQNSADNPTDHRGCSKRMGHQRRIPMTSDSGIVNSLNVLRESLDT